MISAETTSRGISSSRPRWVNRDMNSSQIKLGSFSENSNAASLALSIKDSAGLSERVGTESAGGDAAGGGSGQGGRAGCVPRFKMGGRRSKEAYSVLAIALGAAEWGRYHWLRLTNQRRVMSCRPEPAWQWRTSR